MWRVAAAAAAAAPPPPTRRVIKLPMLRRDRHYQHRLTL